MPPKNKKSVTKKKPETKSLEMPSIFQKINRTSRIFAPVSNNINLLEDIEVKMKKYKEAIKNNNDKPLDTDYMNPALLNCLDSVVKQVKIIENPHIKNSQIKHIHDWYLEKLEKYNSIKKINSRTKKFDWEYIKDKTDLKSNYFEAYNVPKEFQRENRTEDISVLPPKDRLKDFKRKEVDAFIEKKQIDKDMSEMEDKKARLISATGSNFRSTMYTSKQIELNSGLNSLNQTASTFGFSTTGKTFYIQDCNLPTKNLENHIKKEIKSNYSFLRPTYKDSNIINEQKFLIEKNKELAYKRNFEEGRQFIDSWGRARSQFKSTINFKLELNKLNEKYEKEMKEEKALKDKVEILSDLKNKKISVIGNDNYSAKDEEINDHQHYDINIGRIIIKIYNII